MNRIWDFLELNENQYIYTEIFSEENKSDMDLVYYEIYLQNNNNKEKLSAGYANSIFNVPSFQIFNDSIYLISNTIDHNQNNNIQIIQIDSNGNISKVEKRTQKIEILTDLFIFNHQISFIYEENNTIKIASLDHSSIKNHDIFEKDNQNVDIKILPLNEGLIFSVVNLLDNFTESYYFNQNILSPLTLQLNPIDYLQIDKYTFFITDKLQLFLITIAENTKISFEQVKLENCYYFRKLNNSSLLVNCANEWNIIEIK